MPGSPLPCTSYTSPPTSTRESLTAGVYDHLGCPEFTIGSEIEITLSSFRDIKNAPVPTGSLMSTLKKHGFHYGNEELYEIISAPFRHPRSLLLAHAALIEEGILPTSTNGDAPQHVSIGAPEVENAYRSHHTILDLITILRITEQMGASTSSRLLSATESWDKWGRFKPSLTWGARGIAGVSVDLPPDPKYSKWVGSNFRIEYRTPAYKSQEQQGQTFDTLYFLTRAVLAPAKGVDKLAFELLVEGAEMLLKGGAKPLQAFGDIGNATNPDDLHEAWKTLGRDRFNEYMKPYADRLSATGINDVLKQRIKATTSAIAEELGMAV